MFKKMSKPYAHPEVLVSTEWLDAHRGDPGLRIVESDEDVLLYNQGHIPEAVRIDWQTDLQDQLTRDYVSREKFEALLESKGISNDTTVVFYGDKSNWWACYAFWAFELFGHKKSRIVNGGRKKWQEEGRAFVKDRERTYPRGAYRATDHDLSIRAFRDEVRSHQAARKPLIDVRSPGEFAGTMLHMPDYPQEGALRAGHIPGAASVPWSKAVDEQGTFKSREELEEIYLRGAGLKPGGETILAYCRIGERSSHTWFVLKYLLGFENVKNYDGSWTEWGNLVGAPIAKSP